MHRKLLLFFEGYEGGLYMSSQLKYNPGKRMYRLHLPFAPTFISITQIPADDLDMLGNDYKHAHKSNGDVLIQIIAYNFSYHPCPENKAVSYCAR